MGEEKKGLGRREFLKIAGLAASATALSPLSAIAIDDCCYTNDKLGFGLTKPEHWQFVSVRDFRAISEETSDSIRDADLYDELRALSGDPVLLVAKHRRSLIRRATPTFTVYANPLPVVEEENLVEYVRVGEPTMAQYLSDYVLGREPSARSISGFRGVTYEYSYSMRVIGWRDQRFRCKYLILHSPRAEFCIPFEFPSDGGETSDPELDSVLASLEFW